MSDIRELFVTSIDNLIPVGEMSWLKSLVSVANKLHFVRTQTNTVFVNAIKKVSVVLIRSSMLVSNRQMSSKYTIILADGAGDKISFRIHEKIGGAECNPNGGRFMR